MLGCLNHLGDPDIGCRNCFEYILDDARMFHEELTKMRENKENIIRKAWRAASAWTVGSHKDFIQVNPDLEEYLSKEMDND